MHFLLIGSNVLSLILKPKDETGCAVGCRSSWLRLPLFSDLQHMSFFVGPADFDVVLQTF